MTPIWTPPGVAETFVGALVEPRDFGSSRGLGVIDGDGKMVAGIVFHDWNTEHRTIEVSGASVHPRWLNRAVADAIFGYAFGFAEAVLFRTTADNPARRLLTRRGARELATGRGVLIVVTEQDWRGWR